MTNEEKQELRDEILFEMHKCQWFLYRAVEENFDSADNRLVHIRESIAKSSAMWEKFRFGQ